MKKYVNTFADDVPSMIERACRLNQITQAELGKLIGYCPQTMSELANGRRIDGMPLSKLSILVGLSKCEYKLERKQT